VPQIKASELQHRDRFFPPPNVFVHKDDDIRVPAHLNLTGLLRHLTAALTALETDATPATQEAARGNIAHLYDLIAHGTTIDNVIADHCRIHDERSRWNPWTTPRVESAEDLIVTVDEAHIVGDETHMTAVMPDGSRITAALPNETIVGVLDPAPFTPRAEQAVEDGTQAFFAEVVRLFPEITSGDVAPGDTDDFINEASRMIVRWYGNNYGRVLDPFRRPIVVLAFDHPELGDIALGFAAEYISPERWNGFARPSFTKEQVAPILRYVDAVAENESRRPSHYDAASDVFMVWNDDAGELDRWPRDERGLFPIGAGAWIWDEALDPFDLPVMAETLF
jgi:hypothetical protein